MLKKVFILASIVAIWISSMHFVYANEVPQAYFKKTLKLNSIDHEVLLLQTVLSQLPSIRYPANRISANFDRRTKQALQKFQKKYKLQPTGVVNKKTRIILNNIAERLQIPGIPQSLPPYIVFAFPQQEAPPPVPIPTLPPLAPYAIPPAPLPQPKPATRPLTVPLPALPPQTPSPVRPIAAPLIGFPVPIPETSQPTLVLPTKPALIPPPIYLPPSQPPLSPVSLPEPLPSTLASPTPSKPVSLSLSLDSLVAPKPSKDTPYFTYSWKANATLTGEEKLPTPVPRPVVVIDGKPTHTVDSNAAIRLTQLYNIYLINDEEKWDEATAGIFLELLQKLPSSQFRTVPAPSWRISLTSQTLPNDLERVQPNKIRISKPAFTLANPQLLPGRPGSEREFHSNRLFFVLLRIFYNSRQAMKEVISTRYGVEAGFGEPQDEFQEFTVDELHFVAAAFEDMPQSFHHLAGLKKIVRRKNGLKNPIYPVCGALAFPGAGYIEFNDKIFEEQSGVKLQQVVAHEMAHFVWANVLDESTRKKFEALSGWTILPAENLYRASDIKATDHPKSVRITERVQLYYRSTTTNFVSEYAASENPSEDFAETLAYYIYNSDWVRTIAPDKYQFIKDVVDGYEYTYFIEKQFTFEVFNLSWDNRFPGKIQGVDIKVFKLENGDNRVVATLELSQTSQKGAMYAASNLESSMGTLESLFFRPVDGNEFLLRAETTISRHKATGYWFPRGINLYSNFYGLQRYQERSQFGWLLFINNEDPDNDTAVLDREHITSEVTKVNDDFLVRIFVPVTDKNEEGLGAVASFTHIPSNQYINDSAEYDASRKSFIFEYLVQTYRANGEWSFRGITTFDVAGNRAYTDIKEHEVKIVLDTRIPDTQKPEVDVASTQIEATPVNLDKPDGETLVTFPLRSRDDISGIKHIVVFFQTPLGTDWGYTHFPDDQNKPFAEGDSNSWKTNTISLRLPSGSPPGTWSLRSMVVADKAGNTLRVNFGEIGIIKSFKVY